MKKSNVKNYNVNFIEKETLLINGRGNSLVWDKANVLCDFVSPWNTKTPNKIEFRALWDYKNLFFYFKVFDTKIHIDSTDNSIRSIGNSDRVELFFRINDSLSPYYCLEIDPIPRIMDFKAMPNKKFDFNWNWPKNDLEVKSQINSQYFVVEIAISITSLKKLNLIKGTKIEAGIFRAKYKEEENSVFNPIWVSWVNPNTATPNFHTPTSFGVLNLIKN